MENAVYTDSVPKSCHDLSTDEKCSHRSKDLKKLRNASVTTMEICFEERRESLLKFAEILYKCTLCSSMPSILTSETSFLCHVKEEHLNKQRACLLCPHCELGFDKEEDVKYHLGAAHSNSAPHTENVSVCDAVNSLNIAHGDKICSDGSSSEEIPITSPGPRNKGLYTACRNGTNNVVYPPAGLNRIIKKQKFKSGDGNDNKKPKDVEIDPKVNIAHGYEATCRIFHSRENMSKIQELTEEILTNNCNADKSHSNISSKSPSSSFLMMNKGYTPEFGDYTKLVREGGSIVYFCQVCNWKSQIKLHFEGHCRNKMHIDKVKAADNKQNEDQEDIQKRKLELPAIIREEKEKTERSNIFESPIKKSKINRTENDENKKEVNASLPKKNSPLRPNKRKRSSLNVVRYHDNAYDWNSSDSDGSDNSYFIPRRCISSYVVNETDKRQISPKQTNEAEKRQISPSHTNEVEKRQISPQDLSISQKSPLVKKVIETENCFQNLHKFDFNNFQNQHPSQSANNSIPSNYHNQHPSQSANSFIPSNYHNQHPSQSANSFTAGKDHACYPTSITSNEEKGCTYIPQFQEQNGALNFQNEKYSAARNLSVFPEFTKKENKMMREESDNLPPRTSSSILNHLLTFKPHLKKDNLPEKCSSMHLCTVCLIQCSSASDLKLHIDIKHNKVARDEGPTSKVEEKEGVGEVSKILKLKEVVPGLIFSAFQGNVSRDQLLQRVSEIIAVPEATQWGPACNKAMRELYPESNAQRKGKYKKTYFFGVAFIEMPQEVDEVSDTELPLLQSMKDVSHDQDRILSQVQDVLEWSGDMEQGVIRDDLLAILAVKLEALDVHQRGTQCNKVMRIAFPDVKMMRKGKFKSTVYFGVNFKEKVQEMFPGFNASSLSSFLRRGRKKKEVSDGKEKEERGQLKQTTDYIYKVNHHYENITHSVIPNYGGLNPWNYDNDRETVSSTNMNVLGSSFDESEGQMQKCEKDYSFRNQNEFNMAHYKKYSSDNPIHRIQARLDVGAEECLNEKYDPGCKEFKSALSDDKGCDTDEDADDERSASPSLPEKDTGIDDYKDATMMEVDKVLISEKEHCDSYGKSSANKAEFNNSKSDTEVVDQNTNSSAVKDKHSKVINKRTTESSGLVMRFRRNIGPSEAIKGPLDRKAANFSAEFMKPNEFPFL